MLPRRLLSQIDYLLGAHAAVAILGPRQVGKTTLAREIQASRPALYLDLERQEDLAKITDASVYLRTHADKLVILDEIQKRPDLFKDLRGLIDEARREGRGAGRFLILGSASHDLLQQSTESLAGRIVYTELTGVSRLELPRRGVTQDQLWLRGGFPPSLLAANDMRSFEWRRAFIRSYLERDIRDYSPRTSLVTMEHFWTMLAHCQGAEWNGARLASGLGVSGHTVMRLRDLLTDLLLVRQLQPWSGNVGKRLVKSPKVYLRDSGLCHALLKIDSYDGLLGHPVVGPSWEAFVIENIMSIIPETVSASFYRSSHGDEIDLVLEHPKLRRWAIEIKRSYAPAASAGFYRACKVIKADVTWVVYPGDERFPLADGVTAIGLYGFMMEFMEFKNSVQI